MLKLTRRPFEDESIFIVDNDTGKALAKVQVTKISGNQVSLGFTAPKGIGITRSELLNEEWQKQAEAELGC